MEDDGEPYGECPRALLGDPEISDGAVVLFSFLSLWLFKHPEETAYAGTLKELAEDMRRSVRTIERHLDQLERRGYVKRERLRIAGSDPRIAIVTPSRPKLD